MEPFADLAHTAAKMYSNPLNPFGQSQLAHRVSAGYELMHRLGKDYVKPEFGIRTVQVGKVDVAIHERIEIDKPFCELRRFKRFTDDAATLTGLKGQPAVLIVAPLSGHYATLLRGTVEGFLQDHEVYITDWVNAREVPMLEGRFDFHDYIDHVRSMLTHLGVRAHVVAVCQPGPPVLAAAALMAEDADPCRPASMTFMGSPMDARLSPTVTNKLAEERPFAWFKSNMIYTVPAPYAGMMRRVYPGFVQLYSFMSMNKARHQEAHQKYFNDLVAGDGDGADKHHEFYDEYLSVLDLTEEFYLQTIDYVFQAYALPKGELMHRGRLVRPDQITDIALMTVEGAKDDISGVGQTQAAHGLCPAIPEDMRQLYVHPDVGHYGVFNGRRFREDIYPKVRDLIAKAQAALA
jgi:poly(3-hydroxybutyrate) depolymerase